MQPNGAAAEEEKAARQERWGRLQLVLINTQLTLDASFKSECCLCQTMMITTSNTQKMSQPHHG
jgi:hypothetical protein